jgi:endoglucanase
MEAKKMKKKWISIVILVFISVACFSANWGEILQKSIYFFEAQQAGPLMAGNRVEWRADATMNDAVKGGWYDAGDHVKFNLPMSYSASMLGWAEYEYKSAFSGSGQLSYLENNTKFVLNYLASCWTGSSYTYQIGSGSADHSWWGPVEVLEYKATSVSNRPAYSVSSGASCVMAQTAAALALGYLNFGDANYLSKAKSLFAKADADKSDANYTMADGFYDSWSGFYDELIWAAYWLYKATNDSSYLTKAVSYIPNLNKQGQSTDIEYQYGNSWDDVHYAALLLIARENNNATAKTTIEKNLDWWVAGANGKSPSGLSWLQSWGCLRYAATTAFLAFVYADWAGGDAAKAATYKTWAISQMNYITGSNERNASYIVGYGTNPPQHPHHRTAHGSWSDQQTVPPNHRHIIYGGLVGGPTQSGSFTDGINDYQYTEVACDYNAALVASGAKMYALYGGTPLSNFPVAETKDDEFFVEAAINTSGGSNFTEIKALANNRSGWPARVIQNLGFRYFMDLSEVFAAGASVSNLAVTTNYVEFPVTISPITQYSGDIYYVQITFNDGKKIFPGGQSEFSGEVQFRISAPSGATYWNGANDPSMQGLVAQTVAKTQYIPIYDGSTLIYGIEPPGGATSAPTATPTAVPTSVPTETPSAVPTGVPTAVPTDITTPTPPGAGLKGDVNGSGAVDIVDALLIAQAYVGLNPANYNEAVADVNCSGAVDIVDALLIAQLYVGLLTNFPC